MTADVSRIISITRLPIILGPVMIHSHWPYEIDSCIQHFCAGVVGFITVPLYYMVAGYLFFQHYDNSWKLYKQKLLKRIYSLLIPYLLWNLIAYIVYTYLQQTMQPSQFMESFWVVADKGGHSPADGPLWFLRTLMILIIAAPFFYYLSKWRYAKYLVSVVVIFWLLNIPGTSSGTVMGGGVFFDWMLYCC